MGQENVKQLIRRATDAYNRRNTDGMLEDWAPDAVVDWTNARTFEAGVYRGHHEIRALMEAFLAAWEEVRIEIVDGPAEVEDGLWMLENVAYMQGRDGIKVQARSAWLITIPGRQANLTHPLSDEAGSSRSRRRCRSSRATSAPWGQRIQSPGARASDPLSGRVRARALQCGGSVPVTRCGRGVARTRPMPTWVLQAITAVRKVPWRRVLAAILWLNTQGRKYWNRLSPDERREVRDLALKSRGSRSNLTPEDEDRLLILFRKLRRPGPAGDVPV